MSWITYNHANTDYVIDQNTTKWFVWWSRAKSSLFAPTPIKPIVLEFYTEYGGDTAVFYAK